MTVRHFLTLLDLSPEEALELVNRAIFLKSEYAAGKRHLPFKNQVLAMIFEKSSTRTRLSFEAAAAHFGGQAVFMSPRDLQLGRGEPMADTARVISRMADLIMVRTYSHQGLEDFAAHSRVPVINGLTDRYHPCQLLADVMTYVEHRGDIADRVVAFIGDGNNMCHSYINAARQFNFKLRIACPEGYDPDDAILNAGGADVSLGRDPLAAAHAADLVVTDVWASMGQEEESHERLRAFQPFQVNGAVMAQAKSDALFMHCLPAHRGEEVSAEVLDGACSVIWDEAENRLHAQKALLEFLLAS